ncbi:MAG TPA: hypothetical protein VF549_17720 [Solirubrobacteraceae bacterium]|jgi:hypothetical protein
MGIFKRIKTPVEGFAEVVECWSDQNNHGAVSNCKMKLNLVDVPGVEPQVVKHHEKAVIPNRWPEVGMRVAVTVDRDHPDRVDPHWDSVFGEMRGGAAGYVAEVALSGIGLDIPLSRGTATEPDEKPDEDWQEQIAALNARFAAGEITYEEMSDGVQRALGDKDPDRPNW